MKKARKHDDKNSNEEGQHLERINTIDGIITDGIEMNRAVSKTGLKTKLRLYFQVFRKVGFLLLFPLI